MGIRACYKGNTEIDIKTHEYIVIDNIESSSMVYCLLILLWVAPHCSVGFKQAWSLPRQFNATDNGVKYLSKNTLLFDNIYFTTFLNSLSNA